MEIKLVKDLRNTQEILEKNQLRTATAHVG